MTCDLQFIQSINQGFVEILGKEDLDDFRLFLKEPSESESCMRYLSMMQCYLSEKFGYFESEGIAISIGKNAYRPIKIAFESVLHFQEVDFRLLPHHKRIKTALVRLIERVYKPVGIPIMSLDTEETDSWAIKPEGPIRMFPVQILNGILQEMLLDVSGGHFFPVEVQEDEQRNMIIVTFATSPIGH